VAMLLCFSKAHFSNASLGKCRRQRQWRHAALGIVCWVVTKLNVAQHPQTQPDRSGSLTHPLKPSLRFVPQSKEERIKELRSAMNYAMDGRSSDTQQLKDTLQQQKAKFAQLEEQHDKVRCAALWQYAGILRCGQGAF
jgi:hypothetical protein